MSRHSLRPPSAMMMAKAEKGANRVNSLLERHLDSAALCEALGEIRTRSLMRYSKKFYKETRAMMERFGTKYGEDTKRAFAHCLSIAVQKEDFSISYDSWLRSFEMLVDELNTKGMDVPGFLRFSFSRVVGACESYETLDAAVRVSIEYSERFGNPCILCRDALPHMAALPFSHKGFVKACNLLLAWLQSAGTEDERRMRLKEAGRQLELSQAVPENAKNFMDFLGRGAPSSSP